MSAGAGERVVVVGAGVAGFRAAERLRELGFAGELVLVGDEPHRPYHRPTLSKQLLTGQLRPADLALRAYPELDVRWRLGTPVGRLDTGRRVLHLPGGEELAYDGLVLATGVQARHLAGAPRHHPAVHVLRTLADARGVRRSLAGGAGPVLVVGGGFTAGEVAATARALGREVHLVARSRTLMAHALGRGLGDVLTGLHRSGGVRLHLSAQVTRWAPQGGSVAALLSDGAVVVAATVVLAVGGVPAVEWLRGSGLVLEDGVLCGPTTHAVGASDVVAAGDVARWPNLRFDGVPRRVEHWLNAVEMGRAAAEALLAGQAAARPFTPVPRFWTEQHGVRVQAAGMPALAQDTVVLAGRPARGRGILGYLRGGRLVGIVGRESPRGVLRWTAELDRLLPPLLTPGARRPEPAGLPGDRTGLVARQLSRAARSQLRSR